MSFRPCSLLLFLCVLLTGVVALESSGVALARDKREEDPTALSAARRRFQEGVRHFDAGQYTKARAAFLQAYALKKHPIVLLNLAESELQGGFEADAATHFAQLLRETDLLDKAQIEQAREGLEKAKTRVAEIVIAVDVDDAYILVDGILRGRSPLPDPLYLSAGTHVIGVRSEGKSVTRQVTAVPGESSTEMINVTPAPSENAPPGAEPSPGEEETETLDEGEAARTEPYVGTGREPFFRWLRRTPLALVGAGAAALGTVGGVAFAISWQTNESAASDTRDNILAAAEVDQVDAPCVTRPNAEYEQACADYSAYQDTAENHRNIALIFGAVALLAVGGTVAGYFVTAEHGTSEAKRRTASSPRIAIAPVPHPRQPGLVVVGSF